MWSGRAVPSTTSFEITTSSMPSRLGRSNMVSSRIPSMIERRPRAPVLRSMALRAMAPSASSASVRSIDSISNSRWYCFTSAFLGWVRMSLSEGSSRSWSVATTGSRPTNSGIRPYFNRSSGSTSREDFAGLAVLRRQDLGAKANRGRSPARGDDLLEPIEGTSAHEQDVSRVDLQEFLLRMLASALRRHRRDGALHDLEQGLLNALARDVAGDRGVVGLAADLVDLVDIDDAALGPLDIVVGGLQQLEDDVLDVLADIAGFGERGRIRHREGHVEDARERLRQQRLARAGRADQQDVRLRELDVVVLGLVVETLVVIMDRDREHLLSVILADDIVVKNFAYLLGGRNAIARLHQQGLVLLVDDVHAQFDALVADEYGRAGDELAHLVLALAAERAVERILGFAAAELAHLRTPTRYKSSQPQPRRPNQAHTRSSPRARKVAAPPPHQSWRKLLRILDRLGCFSFLSALASIWRMRSRVTENRWPTSSSVWSLFMPMPKRMRIIRSSRGVSEASVRVVVSRRFEWIAASIGRIAFLSSMKSPRCEFSSSPIGVSSDNGSLAILSTLRTFSSGMRSFSASSSGVGSRPISLSIWREVRTILLMVSIMCTGMRMVRAWSAIERVMAWRIHQVA